MHLVACFRNPTSISADCEIEQTEEGKSPLIFRGSKTLRVLFRIG